MSFRKHFRRGKSANKGHPAYIYAKIGDEFVYIGLTHGEITDGIRNIKLEKNPNPEDQRPAYIRPDPQQDQQNKFGRKLSHWSFSEADQGKVKGVMKKNKPKKKK